MKKWELLKQVEWLEKFSENGVYLNPYKVWGKGEGYPWISYDQVYWWFNYK